MSGPIIMDKVMGKIKAAVEEALAKAAAAGPGAVPAGTGGEKEGEQDPVTALIAQIRGEIVKGLQEYRAERTIYESALGNFIVEQNPYTTWENLILPNLPMNPDGENKWVRKSGPLAENHAGNPLDYRKAIPGGTIVDFTWAAWDYLADEEEKKGTKPVLPSYVATGAAGDPLAPPESDPKNEQLLPAKFTDDYGHNIVKTVRLKYRFLDRRYKPTDAVATNEAVNARDVHTGYILIMYSGSDGS